MQKEGNQREIDKRMQQVLGTLLRSGVLISTLIILIGGLVFLYQNSTQTIAFDVYKPQNTIYISLPAIFKGLSSFNGLAIVQFGIFLLILTPITRIFFSIFGFLIEKDYMYVLIGALVLLIIFTSLYLDVVH